MAIIEINIRAENGENIKDAVLRAFGINTDQEAVVDAAPLAAAPTQTNVVVRNLEDDIVNFLRSDPRYTMRTATAIVGQMPFNNYDVRDALEDMVSDGTLGTKTRRADGATLYYVR